MTVPQPGEASHDRIPSSAARILKFVVFMPGRHEGQLVLEVAQPRSRQIPDDSFTGDLHAPLVQDEQVAGRTKPEFRSSAFSVGVRLSDNSRMQEQLPFTKTQRIC